MQLSLTILEPDQLVKLAQEGLADVYASSKCLDIVSPNKPEHSIGIGSCWCKYRVDIVQNSLIIIHASTVEKRAYSS